MQQKEAFQTSKMKMKYYTKYSDLLICSAGNRAHVNRVSFDHAWDISATWFRSPWWLNCGGFYQQMRLSKSYPLCLVRANAKPQRSKESSEDLQDRCVCEDVMKGTEEHSGFHQFKMEEIWNRPRLCCCTAHLDKLNNLGRRIWWSLWQNPRSPLGMENLPEEQAASAALHQSGHEAHVDFTKRHLKDSQFHQTIERCFTWPNRSYSLSLMPSVHVWRKQWRCGVDAFQRRAWRGCPGSKDLCRWPAQKRSGPRALRWSFVFHHGSRLQRARSSPERRFQCERAREKKEKGRWSLNPAVRGVWRHAQEEPRLWLMPSQAGGQKEFHL